MIGLLVVFLLSWLLLRGVAREPIAVLGIAPSKRRLVEFLVGGLFMSGVGVVNFVWQAHFKKIGYQLNPDYGVGQMLAGSLWVLGAVVLEERTPVGANRDPDGETRGKRVCAASSRLPKKVVSAKA